jgi:hypothetical protein
MLFGCVAIALFHIVLGFTYRAGIKGFPILFVTLYTIACYSALSRP